MKIIQQRDVQHKKNISAKIRSLLIIPANLLILSFSSTKIKFICDDADDSFEVLLATNEYARTVNDINKLREKRGIAWSFLNTAPSSNSVAIIWVRERTEAPITLSINDMKSLVLNRKTCHEENSNRFIMM